MPLWGKTDVASNSTIFSASQVQLTPNTDNSTALYGNTTMSAFIANQRIGQFGADTSEVATTAGVIALTTVTSPGSGYTANAAVTVSGGGGSSGAANAHANSTGRIDEVKISNAGSSYETNPTIVIAAPAAITFNANTALYKDITFNANTGVNGTTETITSTSHGLSNGDKVQYLVAAGNTAIGGLSNGTSYFVIGAATNTLRLAATAGGANIDITATSVSETGHTLRRVGQGYITLASNVLQVNDYITYAAASGNTALTGLTSGSKYYVVSSNSTTISLSATKGAAAIVLTPGVSETGHSFTGETATATATVGGGQNKGISHAGWVLRTEGTGGRAGRVQYETLVAMGSMTSDGSDDTILPDA